MHFEMKTLLRVLSGAAVLAIYGCGGGSGGGNADDDPATEPEVPVVRTLSGTAASGAPFTDAVVTVLDRTGALVGTSDPVGADGRYTVMLATGAQPPFVLIASRTGAPGEAQSLVSVLESTGSVANVTPVTHLIASRLSSNGDPLTLAQDLAAGRAQLSATQVGAAVAEIRQILAPVLAATGTAAVDPIASDFAADGTGYDRLLDSIRVEIIPADAASSNIEIGIRQAGADDTVPAPVIQFSSAQSNVASILAANDIAAASIGGAAIASETLVASGTSALIAELLRGLNDCYALPTHVRVDLSTMAATGANIVAPQCRNLFAGNDPASFKNGGASVGGGQNKPFRGMFFDGGTGTVFSQGNYEYTRPSDGRIAVSYRNRNADGDETFGTVMVRLEDGKLKLVGNGYDYPAEVVPSQQLRRQITLGQEPFSYYSTGYNLNVGNVTQAGASIFDRVEVTTPRGNVLTLRPRPGRSQLVLQYNYLPNPTGSTDAVNGLSNTGELRLRSEYVDAATPANPPPRAKETARLYFANPANFPDDASIESMRAQSVWTFRYYLASDPDTLAATQAVRTRTRPLSIRELRYQGLMALDEATLARLRAASNPIGTPPEGQALLPSSAPLEPFTWTVPDRALPPTSATLYGLLAGTSTPFDDGVRTGSTERAAQILCPAGDAQCHPTVNGAYAENTYMNGVSLNSTDATGRSFSMYYSMVRLNP